jgi:hypothetical protein
MEKEHMVEKSSEIITYKAQLETVKKYGLLYLFNEFSSRELTIIKTSTTSLLTNY